MLYERSTRITRSRAPPSAMPASARLKNGRALEKFVEHAVGSVARPMSDGELEAKFRGLAAGVLTGGEAERLVRLCWGVGQLRDAAEIARASIPAGAERAAS